jgi:hypothetical protein
MNNNNSSELLLLRLQKFLPQIKKANEDLINNKSITSNIIDNDIVLENSDSEKNDNSVYYMGVPNIGD